MDKKSDRLEIRLSHTDKEDFQTACEVTGETPSNVMRRYIRRYIRRVDKDELSEGWHALLRLGGRNRVKMGAALAGTGFLVGAVILLAPEPESKTPWPAPEESLFAIYDTDGDGLLKVGDLRPGDAPLFKVLDVDASGAIEADEFIREGEMAYGVNDGPRPAEVTIEACLAFMSGGRGVQLVSFDLSRPDTVMVVDGPMEGHPGDPGELRYAGFDRLVVWNEGGKSVCGVISNFGYAPRAES